MYELRQAQSYERWFAKLRDARMRARVLARLDLVRLGQFGDCHFIGERVWELRLDLGPGYRIYLMRKPGVVVCLSGGDKSTQRKDIARAKAIARKEGAGTWD